MSLLDTSANERKRGYLPHKDEGMREKDEECSEKVDDCPRTKVSEPKRLKVHDNLPLIVTNPNLKIRKVLAALRVPADMLLTADRVETTLTIPNEIMKKKRARIIVACVGPKDESPYPWMPKVNLSDVETISMEVVVNDVAFAVPEPRSSMTASQVIDITETLRRMPCDDAVCQLAVRVNSSMVLPSIWEGTLYVVHAKCYTAEELGRSVPDLCAVARKKERSLSQEDLVATLGAHALSWECPLTRLPMERPGRGKNCEHEQCFELAIYIQEACRMCVWLCPVCSLPVPYGELVYIARPVETEGTTSCASRFAPARVLNDYIVIED